MFKTFKKRLYCSLKGSFVIGVSNASGTRKYELYKKRSEGYLLLRIFGDRSAIASFSPQQAQSWARAALCEEAYTSIF